MDKSLYLIAAAALAATILWSPPAETQRSRLVIDEDRVSAWIEDSQSALKAPVLAVGIVRPDEDLFLEVFGPAEVDSRFLIGPLSQSVTAMALLLVMEDHEELTLESPASTWVDDVPSTITIGHLLRHESGLQAPHGFSPWTATDASLKHLLQEATWNPPGAVEPQDLNYAILGAVIEAVAGEPYAAIVAERIFEPLGMENSSATSELAQARLVEGHQYYFGFPAAREEPAFNPVIVPARFVTMSPRDMSTWLRLFLNEGRVDDEQVIPSEIVETFREEGLRSSGATATFTSAMALADDEDIGAFVFANTNSWNASGPTRILDGVLASLAMEDPPRGSNFEFLVRIFLGFLLLIAVINCLYEFLRWLQIRSFKLNRREAVVALVAFGLGAAAVAAVWLLYMPLPVLHATQPDLALALVLFATLIPLSRLFTGFMKTFRSDAKSVTKYFGF